MIRESRMNGPRKAQDILVALKLTVRGGLAGSYAAFADELGMSASEVHAAVRRLDDARLLEIFTANSGTFRCPR